MNEEGTNSSVCEECGNPMPETRVVCDDCELMHIAIARTFGLPMPNEADYIKPTPHTKDNETIPE